MRTRVGLAEGTLMVIQDKTTAKELGLQKGDRLALQVDVTATPRQPLGWSALNGMSRDEVPLDGSFGNRGTTMLALPVPGQKHRSADLQGAIVQDDGRIQS